MIARFAQPGILAPPPPLGRALTFGLTSEGDPGAALARLREAFEPDWGVAGIGEPALLALHRAVPGLRSFPGLSGPGIAIPSTQQAIWIFLRGDDRGVLFDRGDRIAAAVSEGFAPHDAIDTFLYAGGRDLTGYEDGTENPREEAAEAAALSGGGEGMGGSSFVAVQRWVHDLRRFRGFSRQRRDESIGRRADTNEEIDDAPESAHVKRSAQESYDPPAFMVRRSMPFTSGLEQGLEFIAYGESLDRFERVLRRMAGLDDGIVDALFTFSRPVTGGYYWCPPVSGGRLDLRLPGV